MTPTWQQENGQHLFLSCIFTQVLSFFFIPSSSLLIVFLYCLCRERQTVMLLTISCKVLGNVYLFFIFQPQIIRLCNSTVKSDTQLILHGRIAIVAAFVLSIYAVVFPLLFTVMQFLFSVSFVPMIKSGKLNTIFLLGCPHYIVPQPPIQGKWFTKMNSVYCLAHVTLLTLDGVCKTFFLLIFSL